MVTMVYVGARTFALWEDALAYALLPFYAAANAPRRMVFRVAGGWAVQGTWRPTRYRATPGLALVDARMVVVSRQMWRRWWMTMPVDYREAVCMNLCVLPRGTASDQGWLAIR